MDKDFRRLFVALPVDYEQAENLAEIYKDLKKFESFLKIVETGNYHITVKFFGSVKSDITESLRNSFLKLNILKQVQYSIESIGAFPSKDKPSVIWTGLKCDEKPLNEIVAAVEGLGSDFGFPAEKRKFVPHLTLARVKKERKISPEFKNFLNTREPLSGKKSVFSELVLFESILKSTGAEYRKIEVIKLI